MVKPMRVFVGTDESQYVPTRVLEYSIRKHASGPVEFHAMTADGMPIPEQPRNRPRTGFSFCRFTIPQRCGYRDRALYLDADMLVFADIAELWRIPFGEQTLLCTWQPETPPAWRGNPAFHTGRHYAVMLLDCDRLIWDVRDVVRGLDEGRYDYQQLMGDLCIVDPGAIEPRIPTEWNSLEVHEPGVTKNIHYTVVPTQPWKCRTNPNGAIWDQHLVEAIAAGFVRREDIERGVARRLIHQDLLRFVGSPGVAPDRSPPPPAAPAVPPAHLLVFAVQSPADLDLLLPVLIEARRRPGVATRVLVDDAALELAPAIGRRLDRHGILFDRVAAAQVAAGATPVTGAATAVVVSAAGLPAQGGIAAALAQVAASRRVPCVRIAPLAAGADADASTVRAVDAAMSG